MAALRPDIVILGSVQTTDFTATQWVEGTARVLKVLSTSSGHVYVLRGTPHLPFDGPSCLASRSWLPWLRPGQAGCSARVSTPRDDDVYRWLQQASSRFENVTALDMNDLVCPNGECRAERHGAIVFRDSQHMTGTFVESLSPYLAERIHLPPMRSSPEQ